MLRSGGNDFQGTSDSLTNDGLTGKKAKAGPGVPTGTITAAEVQERGLRRRAVRPDHQGQAVLHGCRQSASAPVHRSPKARSTTMPAPPLPGLTQAMVGQIVSIAKSKYNYDAGGVLNNSRDKRRPRGRQAHSPTSRTRSALLAGLQLHRGFDPGFTQNAFTTPLRAWASNQTATSPRTACTPASCQLNSDWSKYSSTKRVPFIQDYKRVQGPDHGSRLRAVPDLRRADIESQADEH